MTESGETIRLSTVIVSYNTRDLTLACIKSLKASTTFDHDQVIVVDNASVDDSASAIEAAFPDVQLIRNDENVGFARAVNQGLRMASGEFVMLLNPDCEVGTDAADRLIDYLRLHPDVGVVAPLVTHPEGRLDVLSAGYLPSTSRIAVHFFGLSRIPILGSRLQALNLRPGADSDVPREVEWVSGACLVAARSLFVELGGLSQRWFMYAEDMDFCARVLDRGLKVVHLPTARVTHEVGASSKTASMLWVDNLEDFYVQRFTPSPPARFVWRLTFALGLAIRTVAYRLRALTRRQDAAAWMTKAHTFDAFLRRAIRRRVRTDA